MYAVVRVEKARLVRVRPSWFVNVHVVGAQFGSAAFGHTVELLKLIGFAEQVVRSARGLTLVGVCLAYLEYR